MDEHDGIVVTQSESAFVDLLERDDFISRLVDITENLAAKKKGICYAINGEWGVGKTFALNLYKEVIRKIESETGSASKYLIFEYNAWEYDYYSEPLIAIVAAILDQIDDKVALISSDNKEILIEIAKEIGKSFLDKALTKLRDKTGLDVVKIKEIAEGTSENAQEKIAENHSYDPFFDFKDILTKLSKTLASLSKDQTVIFIVDELDRCLPKYTIKVLERLHHLFENVPNVQVILSVDKRQLESIVSQIYGNNASVHRYLAKFIDFELKLDFGTPTNFVKACYSEYYDSFSFEITSEEEALSFYTTLFQGTDMRRCKAIVEKSFLCHQLVYPNTIKCDVAVLCVELFLSLLKDFGINAVEAKKYAGKKNLFSGKHSNVMLGEYTSNDEIFSSCLSSGLVQLESYFKGQNGELEYCSKDQYGRSIIINHKILGLILGVYRLILGLYDQWIDSKYDNCISEDLPLKSYVKKYWEYLNSID